MNSALDTAYRVLQVIAAACLLAFGMLIMCFSTAGVVLLQLLAAGVNKYISLGISILVAVGCSAFIAFNHKIRTFINSKGTSNNEQCR